MCNRPDAITAQDARFSLQYCLAAQLVLEGVRLEAFRPAALVDPRIRRLMPRITVSEGADLAAFSSQSQAGITAAVKGLCNL